jgi:hypothetical protein
LLFQALDFCLHHVSVLSFPLTVELAFLHRPSQRVSRARLGAKSLRPRRVPRCATLSSSRNTDDGGTALALPRPTTNPTVSPPRPSNAPYFDDLPLLHVLSCGEFGYIERHMTRRHIETPSLGSLVGRLVRDSAGYLLAGATAATCSLPGNQFAAFHPCLPRPHTFFHQAVDRCRRNTFAVPDAPARRTRECLTIKTKRPPSSPPLPSPLAPSFRWLPAPSSPSAISFLPLSPAQEDFTLPVIDPRSSKARPSLELERRHFCCLPAAACGELACPPRRETQQSPPFDFMAGLYRSPPPPV